MKRPRPLPLFEGTEPDVFLFDTSAWLGIESLPNREDIWSCVRDLVKINRLFTCQAVINELRQDAIYETRIKPAEKALLSGDRSNDPQYLLRVGKITHDFPAMSKARGSKTPADPYIIALAKEEGYVVVADETTNKRKSRKIPGVCEQLKIRCVTLRQFVALARS
jgi:hypothetical protein